MQPVGEAVWRCEYRIRRDDRPITLEEWESAVASTECVRLERGSASAVNPTTGEVINIPAAAGEAEIFVPEHGKRLSLLRWRPRQGDIAVPLTAESIDQHGTVRATLQRLASRLKARIVGMGGETYE